MLEVDQEWRDQKKRPDDQKPKQALGEVRVDAQQHARNHGGEFGLSLAIDEITHPNGACEDADD